MWELLVLLIFIIVSALVSLILMNHIAYPLSLFAVHNPKLYTYIVKWSILFAIALYILFRLVRRIRISRAEGIPVLKSLSQSLLRRTKGFAFFCIALIAIIIFIIGLHLLLKYNYIILYEISQ
jgi:hypothetical protein